MKAPLTKSDSTSLLGLARNMRAALTAVVLTLAISTIPSPGHALLVLDSNSFGTAVHFNQQALTCCSGGAAGIALIQDGVASSSDIQLGTQKESQARAIASGAAFDLGIRVLDASTTNGANPAAGAIGASGVTINGAAGPLITGGTIHVDGSFLGGIGAGWIVDVFVTDFLGHFLANLDIGAQNVTDPVTGVVIGVKPTFTAVFCANPLEDRCRFTDAGFGDWSGSFDLPFVFPNVQDNGLIVELWGIAATNVEQEVRINFLETAGLAWNPPPGVIVSLATGQTFGQQQPGSVPEPTTLLLLAIGLAAIGWCRKIGASAR